MCVNFLQSAEFAPFRKRGRVCTTALRARSRRSSDTCRLCRGAAKVLMTRDGTRLETLQVLSVSASASQPRASRSLPHKEVIEGSMKRPGQLRPYGCSLATTPTFASRLNLVEATPQGQVPPVIVLHGEALAWVDHRLGFDHPSAPHGAAGATPAGPAAPNVVGGPRPARCRRQRPPRSAVAGPAHSARHPGRRLPAPDTGSPGHPRLSHRRGIVRGTPGHDRHQWLRPKGQTGR